MRWRASAFCRSARASSAAWRSASARFSSSSRWSLASCSFDRNASWVAAVKRFSSSLALLCVALSELSSWFFCCCSAARFFSRSDRLPWVAASWLASC